MTRFAPSDALLAAYASGTASPGMSLLVETHLAMAPAARPRLAEMESVGGVLLEGTTPAPMREDALDATLALLDAAPLEPEQRSEPDGILPAPLAAAVGGRGVDDLRWQFRLPGLHEVMLGGFSEGEEVSLLRARPGAGIMKHTHRGEEATLILTGEMTDGDTVLRAGDVSEADGDHDHRPRITGDETCYCLIVMSGGMRFTGPFGRALNLFT